ncbi:unnamed protein product, partial [Mesorhabditis spiculigera]
MAFPFNPNQLLGASQSPSTPIKDRQDVGDTVRYLAANGPLFQLQGLGDGDMGMFVNGMYPGYGMNGERRKNATRETTAPLKAWLHEHKKNPYPSKQEKVILAVVTKMSMTQVSTWFANARRRLKKEHKNEWDPRCRPSDEDGRDDDHDDDLNEIDVNERPSSSTSDISNSENRKRPNDSESNNNSNRDARTPQSPNHDGPTPKKSKIWSIADIQAKKEDPEVVDARAAEEHDDQDGPGASRKPKLEPEMGNQFGPMYAFQQMMMQMMQRGAAAGPPAQMMPPQFGRPMPGLPGFPLLNPMFLLQQQAMAAAAAAAAQQQASPQQTNVAQLNVLAFFPSTNAL